MSQNEHQLTNESKTGFGFTGTLGTENLYYLFIEFIESFILSYVLHAKFKSKDI